MQHGSLLRRLSLLLLLLGLTALLSPARAQLPVNGSVNGSFTAAGTFTSYSIVITQDGNLNVRLQTSAALAASIYLYDQSNTNYVGIGASAGGGGNVTFDAAHIGPGTYHVRVYRDAGSGTYTVSDVLTPPALANDTEPNDTAANAKAIGENASKTGHLGYSRGSKYSDQDPFDWYKVTISKDGNLNTNLKTNAALAASIYLYDQAGANYTGIAAAAGGGGNVNFNAPRVGAGTYYILVQRDAGQGDYTLQNTLTPPALANDTEPNDTPANAKAIGENATKTGHIGYAFGGNYATFDTDDWYKVTITQDGNLNTNLKTNAALAASIYLYDQAGANYTGIGASAGNGGNVNFNAPRVGAGTYYIAVHRDAGQGDYTLKNTLTPPALTNDAELNDTPATAVAIADTDLKTGHIGYSRNGNYATLDTNDWYKVTISKDGNLNTNLKTNVALAASVYLFDSNGTDYTGIGASAGGGGNVNWNAPHVGPGTYYILVQRDAGQGDYELKTLLTPPIRANDTEVNDTFTKGLGINQASTPVGHLGYSRTKYADVDNDDWYKVTIYNAGNLNARLQTNATLAASIGLFDTDGTTYTGFGASAGGNGDVNWNAPHIGPGTYYILVHRDGGYGDYALTLTLTSPAGNSDPEPNDSSANAADLPLDTPTHGWLGYSRANYATVDSDDWYKVTVPADGDIAFNLKTNATLAASIGIFDTNGSTYLGYGASAGGNGNVGVFVPHLGPGTYYILVHRDGGYGTYDVTANWQPNWNTNDPEPNNTLATAAVVPTINNRTGHLGYSRTAYGDIDGDDFYKITLPAGVFSLTLNTNSTLAASISLYNSAGTYLGYGASAGGNGQVTFTTNALAAGTYYIGVHRDGGYGTYALNRNATATVAGVVTLEACSVPNTPVSLILHPTDNSGDTLVAITNGAFSVGGLARKTYIASFKGSKWLRKNFTLDLGTGNVETLPPFLLGGDATNDNAVNFDDFLVLTAAYFTTKNVDALYDPAADFTCDDTVNFDDFLILAGNYFLEGDPLP